MSGVSLSIPRRQGVFPLRTPAHLGRESVSSLERHGNFPEPRACLEHCQLPYHHSSLALLARQAAIREIISLLLFIPRANQQPTACTVERAPTPRAVGAPGSFSYQPGNQQQKTKGWEKEWRERDPVSARHPHNAQVPGERQSQAHQEPRATLHSSSFCSWGWGSGR
jgi:hypothetical protein